MNRELLGSGHQEFQETEPIELETSRHVPDVTGGGDDGGCCGLGGGRDGDGGCGDGG